MKHFVKETQQRFDTAAKSDHTLLNLPVMKLIWFSWCNIIVIMTYNFLGIGIVEFNIPL